MCLWRFLSGCAQEKRLLVTVTKTADNFSLSVAFSFMVVHRKEDSKSHLKTANIFSVCGVFYVIVHRKEDFLLHLKKATISLCLRSFLCGCAQLGTWLWV